MKLYTSVAIARYLDMTERNVRTLRDKGILTEYKPGLYDLQTGFWNACCRRQFFKRRFSSAFYVSFQALVPFRVPFSSHALFTSFRSFSQSRPALISEI